MHPLLKVPLRKIIFPLAIRAGVAGLLRKMSGNKRLIIMYHGVSEQNCFGINGRHLPVVQFEKHLKYYQKHYRVISLQKQFDWFREGNVPATPAIALTFDDGFANNAQVALALLEKYSMPATFFVSAIALEQKNVLLWPEMIEIAMAFVRQPFIELAGKKFVKKGNYKLSDESGISVYKFLDSLNASERTAHMAEFAARYKVRDYLPQVPAQCWQLMDREQLQQLSASPLAEIGSHGYSHHSLANATEKEALTELQYSKKLIEEFIQKPVVSFAFPNGSYNKGVRQLALEAGYKNLLAAGDITSEELSDKNILPRIGISNYDDVSANMLNISYRFRTHGF